MRADLEVLGVGEHPDAALHHVPLVSLGVGSLELSLNIRKRLFTYLFLHPINFADIKIDRTILYWLHGFQTVATIQCPVRKGGLDRDAEN